jgi:CheY-like chemotaxis protein
MSSGAHRPIPLVAVIDDEEDITTYLGMALEDSGLDVLLINDAATAIGELDRRRPDLICLDLLMPEQMGTSLYLTIRRTPQLARTPVVILSGLSGRDTLAGLLKREPDVAPPAGYIDKPVSPERFVETVRELLNALDAGASGADTRRPA